MAWIPAEIPVTQQDSRHADLPALIDTYVQRALPSPGPAPAQIRIEQTGEMRTKPDGHRMHFTATEWLAVERTAFCWQARFRLAPVVAIRVRDCYDSGRGTLRVRALGVPLQRRVGPEVAIGEAYRYLAELPWVPHAITANDELEWQQVEDRRVEVSCLVNDERIAVVFELDASGDIFRCFAAARPRDGQGRAIPTPWGGAFSDYRLLGGVRVPARAEVHWDLPEGRFVYWRGHVTDVSALEEPFDHGTVPR